MVRPFHTQTQCVDVINQPWTWLPFLDLFFLLSVMQVLKEQQHQNRPQAIHTQRKGDFFPWKMTPHAAKVCERVLIVRGQNWPQGSPDPAQDLATGRARFSFCVHFNTMTRTWRERKKQQQQQNCVAVDRLSGFVIGTHTFTHAPTNPHRTREN